jgi:hypothetical protein
MQRARIARSKNQQLELLVLLNAREGAAEDSTEIGEAVAAGEA